MADENVAGGSRSPGPAPSASNKATTSGFSATAAPAPIQGIRRSFTLDETRRRPPPRRQSPVSDSSFPGIPRRRSSNFTEYSLGEARDILNPRAKESGELPSTESSSLASASLAFALLPAIAGAVFKNGSAIVTDLMLLGLAGVFLHWSVTQPWAWYHSAQEVRVQHEVNGESALDEESGSEFEGDDPLGRSSTSLEDVPEDDSVSPINETQAEPRKSTSRQRSALRELYRYEVTALFACFILPIASAYLLHTIRAQLSRPSEGLVSNYNLTIFTLVSELRVFSHMFKLVQSRTLHLQRIVHDNPYGSHSTNHRSLNDISERLTKLEARFETGERLPQKQQDVDPVAESKQMAAISRDVRNAIQPELDALNRAVRRYEKKATVLQFQTDSRFSMLESKMDDAIALAAAAAKNSAAHNNVLIWIFESIAGLILIPINAILHVLLLPIRSFLNLTSRKREKPVSLKASRATKSNSNKTSVQARYSGDRVPTRVSKR
ncbi:unnamed protein product [Clonostachys rosea]|uniref:DUF4349 domain-containing protein n=1 Tax=Bionectria ochroleuca TaxID=29856 RepID=A0ABY6UQS2_BIOOC|nr:unnamed protein product [Clonostachys rosea]